MNELQTRSRETGHEHRRRGPHFRLKPALAAGPAIRMSDMETFSLAAERLLERPAPSELAKRSFDFFAGLVLLVVLAIPMAVVALLVKLTSRGPAFYCQERIGRDGAAFMLWKFRTMRIDAEAQSGPVWARKDDPRCTWIGGILRRLSIDELPQLFNVIRGEMSLVGPRPERPYFVEQFSREYPHYSLRHIVAPGLTGWAQIHGLRGNTSLRKRLDYDLEYIRRRSLLLDIAIVVVTPFKMFTDPNAY